MSHVQREILSATLKAEAVRIRHLRDKARKHRELARKSDDTDHKADHYGLMFRFQASSDCPSERARCANLALGFLRGTPYLRIEATTRTPKHKLFGYLSREIAKKACVSHDDVTAWLMAKETQRLAA